MRVGWALLEGPTGVFPPETLDDYGWLETDFRLIIQWPRQAGHESISILSDDTVNRDSDFLPPMIRHCQWNRSADLTGANAWPTTSITLAYIRDRAKIDALLREVHGKLPALPFEVLGLSTQRDMPELECDDSEPTYWVWVRNGVQYLEYHSAPVVADKLVIPFREIYTSLLAEMIPITIQGWRERYDYDLRDEPLQPWELPIQPSGPA